MERVKFTGPAGSVPAGHTVLIIRGPRGAVSLEAWRHAGEALGVLNIHYPQPMYEGQNEKPCEVLPEGYCYSDCSFHEGFEQAPSILAGYDSYAWVTLLSYYRERIEPDEKEET